MGNANGASQEQKAEAVAGSTFARRLASVTRGKSERPFRILLYSPEGCGKTTFAASAPDPIFIGTEDGSSYVDVARFQRPKTWEDIAESVGALEREDHKYKTLVIDTLDWAEPLCWAKVIADAPNAKDGKKPESIEEVGGGYGKGFQAALDIWRQLVSGLERLQANKQMHVILLAHSILKTYRNPEGEDFDRYTMKFNEKASGLFREWCDELLFANFETFATKDKNKRIRGVSSGTRLIYTTRRAAFDAKTRRSLPESLPLDWGEFEKAAKAHQSNDPSKFTEAIKATAAEMGGELEKETLAALGRVGQDAVKLAALNNWATAKLQERS
jgi:hypothetical protein